MVIPGVRWRRRGCVERATSNLRVGLRIPVLLALVFVAGWLRFTATSFGLPERFRPDESLAVLRSLGFEKDWNPHLADYPAAQLYLLHGVMRAYATVIGGDLHAVFDPDHQALALLVARGISAAMGTATVAAVYLAAESVFGPTAALASAAVVTFATIHVRESKFAKVEVPSGFWLTLAIAMMLRIVCRGRRVDYALAGLFSGLAAATHYGSAVVVVGILAAHFEARHRENRPLLSALGDLRIYVAGVATVLTFFCATPYVFLDWAQTVHDYRRVTTIYKGAGLLAAHGWRWLFMRAVPDSLGVSLMTFMLVSVVWAILRPRPGVIALLAFIAAAFLSLIVGNPLLVYRYVLNPLLGMALLARRVCR